MKNKATLIIKKALSKLGYKIDRIRILGKELKDPRELTYLSNLPYNEIELPLALGNGMKFYSLADNNILHPYIVGLKMYENSNEDVEAMRKTLKDYGELVNYKSGNEALGLNEGPFVDEHGFKFYTFPWSTQTPEERKKWHDKVNTEENLLFNHNSPECLETPGSSFKKVIIESTRLINLLDSIKENGYNPQFHDALNCFVLLKNDKWKWIVESGQHRISVLSYLGYKKVPCHIRKIVRREEVSLWPGVLNGLFSEKEALSVFDQMFNSSPPKKAGKWIEYVNKLKV